MVNFFNKIFCYALLIVVAVSYMDAFNPDGAVQSSLSSLFRMMTIVLFFTTFRISAFKAPFIKNYIILLLFLVISALMIDAVIPSVSYMQEVVDVVISLVCVCIGYSMSLDSRDVKYMYLFYGIALLITGATLIDNNIGGLLITDDYKIDSKNGIGAMAASMAVSLFVFLSAKCSKVWRLLTVVMIVLSLVVLLTIRARASTMTVLISFMLYIIQSFRNGTVTSNQLIKWVIFSLPIIIAISYFIGTGSFGVASEYVYDSLFQNVEDDVTTGRVERNIIAWEYFTINPLFGRLTNPVSMLWVHNYLLRIVADYGLIGGLSLVVLYVYLICHVIKVHWVNKTTVSANYVGYWAIIPLLLLSVVEPLFPYSPGTSIMFSFLLLGYSNRANQESCRVAGKR